MKRSFAPLSAAVLIAVAVGTPAAAAIKKVPYPEVKVELADPYKPDAAFTAMRKAFGDAVKKKDDAALSALVGQIFLWTMGGAIVDQYDRGRDALHNFKVAFGFRDAGKDADGGVEGGPFWDLLASFATDETAYVQPTRVELIAKRGAKALYHFNGVTSWGIAESGEVRHVYA